MESKFKILVIDDEIGIRKGCRRVLEPSGYTVDSAASFREGLTKIKQEQFDLVLLDVMMPDGRGVDLLAPIHEQDPETVAVVITGYATVEMAVETIKRGAYDFIAKPFTTDLLLTTVERGLEKRRLSLDAKRLQVLEKEAYEQALAREQAEKLDQFKSSFATMVAHELRSPVAGVQSLVRTLLRGMAGDLTGQQKEVLSRVETRLDFLLHLINDLLTLAASKSMDDGKPLQPVVVQTVLQRVLDRFMEEARSKPVTIQQSLPAGPLVVHATEDGLDSILRNLVGNAIKYTTAGGEVRVECEQMGGEVELRVADTGIGISKEDLAHIGEEFFRAKNAHLQGITGTGLGMSIVRQYIDRFNGQLSISSEEGKGSTFTVRLPLWSETRSPETV
ncbi:MAG TPA: hybrid sensor histidine kinase/response regulator [Anaerolineales bacterium]|nr:hybrid sensor histidine kinase/response regulator [Anaerolineales bacterium]